MVVAVAVGGGGHRGGVAEGSREAGQRVREEGLEEGQRRHC